MQVEALGLSHEVDFGDGSVTNFLSLRLPNGDIIKALISDAAVGKLAAQLGDSKPSSPAARVPPPAPQAVPSGDPFAVLFGGTAAPPAAPPSAPAPAPSPPPRPKILHVEKDALGYPIVRQAGNVVDPQQAFGASPVRDEDGIGQG